MKKIPNTDNWSQDSRFTADFGKDAFSEFEDSVNNSLKYGVDPFRQADANAFQRWGTGDVYALTRELMPYFEINNPMREIAKAQEYERQQIARTEEKRRYGANIAPVEAGTHFRNRMQEDYKRFREGQGAQNIAHQQGSNSTIAMKGVGCYGSLGEALQAVYGPPVPPELQTPMIYGPVDTRTELEKIRYAAEDAEAEYDSLMKIRSEAEAAEEEYNSQVAEKKSVQWEKVAMPLLMITTMLLLWPKSQKLKEVAA